MFVRWSPIDELPTDTQWVEEFEKGIDWRWPYAGDLVLMRLGILEKRKVRLACHASGIDPISKSREKGAASNTWATAGDSKLLLCHVGRCLRFLQGRQRVRLPRSLN